MENKNEVYNANIIKAIDDISNKHSDMLKNMIKSIKAVNKTTLIEKNIYIREIDEYKKKRPLVDLLPFDYLGPLKGTFYERAHTMILAFLLNPKCSGEFAKQFLENIFILNKIEIGERNISKYKITKVLTEQISLKTHNTGGMPDIVIKLKNEENNKLDIIIENKCMATESRDQTPKYLRETKGKRIGFRCKDCIKQKNNDGTPLCNPENKIFLFIDYKGHQATCRQFKSLNYYDIKKSLDKTMTDRSEYLGQGSLYSLIDHYSSTIDVMAKDECIVSYSDLESIKDMSLMQCKYLFDRINNQKPER